MTGSPVYIAHSPDEVEVLKEEVEEFVANSLKAIKVAQSGVYVQASTLGSLEALLEFLKTSKIPVSCPVVHILSPALWWSLFFVRPSSFCPNPPSPNNPRPPLNFKKVSDFHPFISSFMILS